FRRAAGFRNSHRKVPGQRTSWKRVVSGLRPTAAKARLRLGYGATSRTQTTNVFCSPAFPTGFPHATSSPSVTAAAANPPGTRAIPTPRTAARSPLQLREPSGAPSAGENARARSARPAFSSTQSREASSKAAARAARHSSSSTLAHSRLRSTTTWPPHRAPMRSRCTFAAAWTAPSRVARATTSSSPCSPTTEVHRVPPSAESATRNPSAPSLARTPPRPKFTSETEASTYAPNVPPTITLSGGSSATAFARSAPLPPNVRRSRISPVAPSGAAASAMVRTAPMLRIQLTAPPASVRSRNAPGASSAAEPAMSLGPADSPARARPPSASAARAAGHAFPISGRTSHPLSANVRAERPNEQAHSAANTRAGRARMPAVCRRGPGSALFAHARTQLLRPEQSEGGPQAGSADRALERRDPRGDAKRNLWIGSAPAARSGPRHARRLHLRARVHRHGRGGGCFGETPTAWRPRGRAVQHLLRQLL